MRRDEVLTKLAEHEAELRAMGVRELSLFGSTVRDEARATSDVDLLVDLERPAGLFKLTEVQLRLEEILGCKVDLGTRESLRARLRDRVLAEAVRVA
jgi:predicted nucleotidyltransferase